MIKEESYNNSTLDVGDKTINVREIVYKYIYHWPVFLLGIFLCFLSAFIYLRYAQPIYSVSTTLLIKDDKKGGMPSGGDLLNELDLFGSSKVVDNEIEILKSKTLMRKVVDRLNLMIAFKSEGRVKASDLYGSSSLNFGVVEIDSIWYDKTFSLTFPSPTTYLLKELKSGKSFKGPLNKLQRNSLGIYKITKNFSSSISGEKELSMIISDPKKITDQLLSNLTVGLTSKQSTVLKLTVQSTVPRRGQDILNTLIQVYNEAALTDKNRTTQSTIDFIDERLKLISGELTEVEKDVEGFKSSRGLTDISSDASLFLENVKMNDIKMNEIDLQLSVIRDINRYVNTSSSKEKLPSTLGINDPVLLSQVNQLSELQLQRDQLLATTTQDNPLVTPINKQIETTRAGIQTSIQNITKSLEVSKAGLAGNNAQFQGSIKQIPGQERQLISIKRQQTIKESLYLYLLQKKEEAALSYASTVADSRTVDPAFYSNIPVKPRRQIVYLIAFLFGIFLPIGYLYSKDLLNNRIEDQSDISKITGAPILGEILNSESAEPIVVTSNSRTAIAEQFRSVRTNMQFLYHKKTLGKGKVTLFTSSMSGEGKSFVASNLAASFAIGGKKTVLLELDLRKPKISKYLSLENKIGLSNYLIGKADVSQIIQQLPINPNLHVIGSGPIPPNPAELLLDEEIENLIEYLRENFDEIVLDTPPIGLVTDAQVLSRLADITIYMVRQNVTFKEQIHNLNAIYQQNKLPKLNVILNGVKLGGSYGYGYGYYSDDVQHANKSLKAIYKDILKRF